MIFLSISPIVVSVETHPDKFRIEAEQFFAFRDDCSITHKSHFL